MFQYLLNLAPENKILKIINAKIFAMIEATGKDLPH